MGGAPAFDPRLLLRVCTYLYLTGVRASRKLAHNTTPEYWVPNRFRARHRGALGNLLVQTGSLAAGFGLVKLASLAIDGTKIMVNASKHKAMTCHRMDACEAKLRAEVEVYLRSVDEHDEDYECSMGPDDDRMSLPPELRDAQARRRKIAQAKRELERRGRERAERASQARGGLHGKLHLRAVAAQGGRHAQGLGSAQLQRSQEPHHARRRRGPAGPKPASRGGFGHSHRARRTP